MNLKLLGAAAGLLGLLSAVAIPAEAGVVYDAVGDFSIASNPNGQWEYGSGVGGTSFAPITVAGNSLLGPGSPANFIYWQDVSPVLLVPLIGKNTGSTPITFGTVFVPTGVLEVHPGPVLDAIVQWTAPTAGSYKFSGLFELLDTNPSGVIGEIFHNGTQIYSGKLSGPGADQNVLTPGQSETFGGTVSLGAGDTLSFVVNNAGSFYNDSTGLSATISAIPETSTWAMLILGFAGIGLVSHRRKNKAIFRFA